MILQVLQMTPEQVNMLGPAERAGIIQLVRLSPLVSKRNTNSCAAIVFGRFYIDYSTSVKYTIYMQCTSIQYFYSRYHLSDGSASTPNIGLSLNGFGMKRKSSTNPG